MYRSFEHKFNVGDIVQTKNCNRTLFNSATLIITAVRGEYYSSENYSSVSVTYLCRMPNFNTTTFNEFELEEVPQIEEKLEQDYIGPEPTVNNETI